MFWGLELEPCILKTRAYNHYAEKSFLFVIGSFLSIVVVKATKYISFLEIDKN